MSKFALTVVIITKNAESTIMEAVRSANFASEVMVVDDDSTDKTVKVAQKLGATVIHSSGMDFAARRCLALTRLKTDWLLYVDADEIITPLLAESIAKIVSDNQPAAYRIKRKNFFLGKEMYADYVDRLFHKSVIKGWKGKVHESPILTKKPKIIEESLLHYTHTSIESMLEKTNQWSEYEVELRLAAKHPLVVWWRLLRIGLTFFFGNYFGKNLWKYGREGLFEAYFQSLDKLIVYTKLWEHQHRKIKTV